MKKAQIFINAVLGFALVLFIIPEVGAQWEEMEVVKYNFEIATNPPRNQWYPEVEYNSIDDEFMILWRSDGPIREDCDPGDEYECEGNFHSMDAQRVSTEGVLLGSAIQLISPNEGYKNGARFAYNMFTNEYMTVNPVSPTPSSFGSEMLIARINNVGNILYGPAILHPGGGGESPLPIVVFNPVRREYLVVYSDRNIYNAHLNLVGFILDEDGSPIHGPFPVGNQLGDYYAARGAYNPTDDNYLVVWEDFRHVADWLEPCDIYGVLLDHEGNMIVEIPVLDDAGMPGEEDQRVPVPAYNPDKNEFLVVAKTAQLGLISQTGAIFGRFIKADDGTLPGPAFTIVDEPRIQHWPNIEYIEEEKKYFMVWNDCRNDGQPLEEAWHQSPAIDVYARWLDDTGSPIGDEILIAEREGGGENWKQVPTIAYSPATKRFLITWYDRHAAGGDTPFAGADSDVFATLYGIPLDSSIIIGDQWANCGDVGVKIPICLINLEVEVGAVQVDLCENVDDCLICVGCEMTERTTIFDCMVNELENGCCAVVVFSKNPGGVINPGECDIVIIDYTLKDDPQCCSSCIKIDGENLEVVDQYGYIVDSLVSDLGMICPFECGDIEPAATTAGWNCGDGDVDIFDILEEVDFIIHVKDPDDCQAVRADVPTGTPPNCDPPDGTIDVGDLMVIIDMALNRQDCCSYYYGGVIY